MEFAVIMASGLGTRMRPLTNDTPKPLLKVNGKPMAETVIDALEARGVAEIAIVVGYLGEQFAYLTEKYPNVRLIINRDYETVNNISSIYYAREFMRAGDCFVCEADLFIHNEKVLCRTYEKSGYFGKKVTGHTDDWVFDEDANGRITRVGKVGDDCHAMVGVSYFKQKDAVLIADAVEEAYAGTGYEELFWDEIVDRSLDRLDLCVHPLQADDIIEIDTPAELDEVNRKFGGKA
ncbi:MAG: NTP transferase domain-containing protein [Oscillospiraceae bacterium]|nr:NTP transferase domain-containing protein [Oscillospiraceae bacterium]